MAHPTLLTPEAVETGLPFKADMPVLLRSSALA